jgi:hypothetical protein
MLGLALKAIDFLEENAVIKETQRMYFVVASDGKPIYM